MRMNSWINVFLGLAFVIFLLFLTLPLLRGERPIDLGLDLDGGLIVHYRPDFDSRLDVYAGSTEAELLDLSKEIISNRLQRRIHAIPDVVLRSDQQIVVSIPGEQDTRRVLDTVGKTYQLSLRLVLGESAGRAEGKDLYEYRGRHLELAPARLTGQMLEQRSIEAVGGGAGALDLNSVAPRVAFRFAPPYDAVFAELTGANIGRELAILIDDEIQWVGVIENEIDGVGTLSGGYTMEQAREIATMLRSGSLPISLEVASVSAVGPSLGQELQHLGWIALVWSIVGLMLLVVAAYYHRPWLLAVGLASLVFLLCSLAGLAAIFDLTLDLAGVAGLILSVGMGMDAFLMVFEGLERKFSQTSGEQLRSRGSGIVRRLYSFAGEGRTLLHANATTVLVLLLLVGNERLHSFALFLLVGIAASMITMLCTRALLLVMWRPSEARENRLLGWLRNVSFRTYRWRRAYFVILALALVLTVLSLLGGQGAESLLGADFRPGIQAALSATNDDQLESAIDRLEQALPEREVRSQQLGTAEECRALITLSDDSANSQLTVRDVAELLGDDQVKIDSLHAIDERVSGARLFRSMGVLVFSFVLLAVYFLMQHVVERTVFSDSMDGGSLVRRVLVFGGVLVAVLLDLGVVLAAMIAFDIQLSLPVVAALLTIVGYSVNDSVVLWTHIQQAAGSLGWADRRASASEVVAETVDRVLSRTVLTSLSTMLPALCIVLVGLTPLVDFALVAMIGTAAGTCSSLFVVGAFAAFAIGKDRKTGSSRKKAVARPGLETSHAIRVPNGKSAELLP